MHTAQRVLLLSPWEEIVLTRQEEVWGVEEEGKRKSLAKGGSCSPGRFIGGRGIENRHPGVASSLLSEGEIFIQDLHHILPVPAAFLLYPTCHLFLSSLAQKYNLKTTPGSSWTQPDPLQWPVLL